MRREELWTGDLLSGGKNEAEDSMSDRLSFPPVMLSNTDGRVGYAPNTTDTELGNSRVHK